MSNILYTIRDNEKNKNNIISFNKIDGNLDKKMENICDEVYKDFCNLQKKFLKIQIILENDLNKNFDTQELIEEKLDELFYEYIKIKEQIKMGREIRFYKEEIEK